MMFSSSTTIPEAYQEDYAIVLGTSCVIRIWGNSDPRLMKESFAILKKIDSTMSTSVEGSDLWQLRENAGKKAVKVNPSTMEVIEAGLQYFIMSYGKLNIAIGPLVSLWDIGGEGASVPEEEDIRNVLAKTDISMVSVNRGSDEVFLEESGMAVDLGSIAKGFASDEVSAYLRKQGVTKAIINLGGNIHLIGRKTEIKKWVIGIQDPFNERGESIGAVAVEDKVVISSGPYERFFIEDGVRYHHILNPVTGYPVVNNIEGITVITNRGIDGDALSTTFFALGVEEGLAFAETLGNTEVVYVTSEKEVWFSSGVSSIYKHFKKDFIVKSL